MNKVLSFCKNNIAYIFIVTAGVVLRFKEYIDNRSLWADEARVANQLMSINIRDVFDPLSTNLGYSQGFILIEKICMLFWGNSEYVLRLLPLVSGVAAMVVFCFSAKKVLGQAESIVAAIMFAVSYELIYFASEAKPYSLDLLVSSVLIYWFIKFFKNSDKELNPYKAGACGLLVAVFSFRCVFVLLGAGVALVIYFYVTRQKKAAVSLFKVVLIWTAVFAGYFFYAVKPFLGIHDISEWTTVTYFTPSILTPNFALWAVYDLSHQLTEYLKFGRIFSMVCFIAGIYSVWKHQKILAAILTGPMFLVVLASFFKYPIYDRLILFLAPAGIILITKGLFELWPLNNSKLRMCIGGIFLLLLLDKSIFFTAQQFMSKHGQQETRPIFEYILEHKQPDDVIYIDGSAWAAYKYYAHFYPLDTAAMVTGSAMDEEVMAQFKAKAENPRVWFVFAIPPDNKDIRQILNAGGSQIGYMIINPLQFSAMYSSSTELRLYEFK